MSLSPDPMLLQEDVDVGAELVGRRFRCQCRETSSS